MFLIRQQLLLYSIFKWAKQNTFKGNILKLRRIVIRGEYRINVSYYRSRKFSSMNHYNQG